VGIAVLWLLVAQVAGLLCAVVIGAVIGLQRGLSLSRGGTPWPTPSGIDFALASTVALQSLLLWVALRRARMLGGGSTAAGLGNLPVRRRGRVALCGVLLLIWLAIWSTAVIWLPSLLPIVARDTPALLGPPEAEDLPALVLRFVLIGALAPIAEECFFRGWLWTALRRDWGAVATIAATGLLWLVNHAAGGPIQPLVLFPAAILLGAAREVGGSVRASLTLHLLNNGIALALQWWATTHAG
jgi:hypothetical protein